MADKKIYYNLVNPLTGKVVPMESTVVQAVAKKLPTLSRKKKDLNWTAPVVDEKHGLVASEDRKTVGGEYLKVDPLVGTVRQEHIPKPKGLTPAEKKAAKLLRIKTLASYSAKESGGKYEDFLKVFSTWSDEDIQEMLLDDRFDRYRNVSVGAQNPAITKGIAIHKERQIKEIQDARETLEKLTGVITSGDDRDIFLTPETIIGGKIAAAKLGNEFSELMKKYPDYISASETAKKSYSKIEQDIFNKIDKLGLDWTLLTGEYVGELLEEGSELDLIEETLQDVKNPLGTVASILGNFDRDIKEDGDHGNSRKSLDVMPLDNLAEKNFYENEYTLGGGALPKIPDYMKVKDNNLFSNRMDDNEHIHFGQQLAALNLYKHSTEQNFFKNVAALYVDELGGQENKDTVERYLTNEMPKRIKSIAIQNASIMYNNTKKLDELVEEYGLEKGTELFKDQAQDFIPYYTAYPSMSEISELGVSTVPHLTRTGKRTDFYGGETDTISSLLGKGIYNVSYDDFDTADDEYRKATILRGALTSIPKRVAMIHGYGDSSENGGLGRREWEGGILPGRKFGDAEEDLQALAEKIKNKEELNRYERDIVSQYVDSSFQPKGDLSPDWEDPNDTHLDQFVAMVEEEEELNEQYPIAVNDGDGVPDVPPSDVPPSDSGAVYQDPSELEGLKDSTQEVDDSFASPAPTVDVVAAQGPVDTGNVNRSATTIPSWMDKDAIASAFFGNRMGANIADRNAVPATKEARLDLAKARFMNANQHLTEHAGEQGSEQWKNARKGMPTASEAWRYTAGDKKANEYLQEKAREAWGLQAAFEGNADTARGTRMEDPIRKAYEKKNNVEVLEMGLLTSSLFPGGASLDGVVTRDGEVLENKGVEFKAPREFGNPNKWRDQMQMQMAITGLDSIDLVQGVEKDGKIELRENNFKADKQWQKDNKAAIQEVQEAMTKMQGMTQEQFLEANEKMAKDLGDKYPFLFRNKTGLDAAETASGGGGKKGGDNSWRKGGVAADPDDSRRRAVNPQPQQQGGWQGKPIERAVKRGADKFANYSKAANAVSVGVAAVNEIAQHAYDASQDFIGPAMDVGMNPGNFLGSRFAMESQGMTRRQAEGATTNLSRAVGGMEIGDFSYADNLVQGSMGYMDYDDIENFRSDPTGFMAEMKDRTKDLSPEAQAMMFEKMGIAGASRIGSSGLLKTQAAFAGVEGSSEMYSGIMTGGASVVKARDEFENLAINTGAGAISNVHITVETKGIVISVGDGENKQTKTIGYGGQIVE